MCPDKVAIMPCARFRPVWIEKTSSEYREKWILKALAYSIGSSKLTYLSSKWHSEQWRYLGLESGVQCIQQQMHEFDLVAVADPHKVLQNVFSAWFRMGVCRARCCALSLATRVKPGVTWQSGQHPSEPAQAPRQDAEPDPTP
jgi:hypothetical protein